MQRGRSRSRSFDSVDFADHTVTLFGDSIAFQNNGSAARNEGYGFFVNTNAMLGQRFTQDYSTNKGLGGDDSAESLARVAEIDGVGDILAISLGANDFGTATGAYMDPAVFVANIAAIRDAAYGYGYDRVFMWSVPPSDDNSADQTAARVAANALLRAMETPTFILVDCWSATADENGNWLTGLSHDGVHPNMRGAAVMGYEGYKRARVFYGVRDYVTHASNVITNPTMTGTGGTVSGTIFTGVLADGWATSGSGGAAGDCVLSKDTDGKQLINFSSATVATFSRRIQWTHTAAVSLKQAYFEVDFEIVTANAGDGLWYTASAEIRNNSAEQGIGYDRQSSAHHIGDTQIKTYQTATARRLLIRSPVVTLPNPSTAAVARFNLEFVNASGKTSNGTVKIHNAQMVITD